MRPFRRTTRYEKNSEQEAFLREINSLLKPGEKAFTNHLITPQHPMVFVVGTPRCGSTFAAQLFPSALSLGYVSNLMARFFETPSIGARLQAMLLEPPTCSTTFQPEYGYTWEIESTHEFGYFWSRWLPFTNTHQASLEALAQVNVAGFLQELAGIEAVFGAPVLFKNLICGLQVDFLATVLPKIVVIDLTRSELCTAESILKARQDAGGSLAEWWSLRPAEYDWLKDLDPFEQIAGQILCTRRRIEQQLATLPEACVMRLTYEQLCRCPNVAVDRLAEKLATLGTPVKHHRRVEGAFDCRDVERSLPNKAAFQAAFAAIEARLADARE